MNSKIGDSAHTTTATESDPNAELKARMAVLKEENRRLREEYATARRAQYRKTAFALVVVGSFAVLAGVLFPAERTVLLALGGTGLFIGLLTYFLTPEEFLPVSIGEQIYESKAATENAIISELDLSARRVYVPTEGVHSDVRLFIPQHNEYALPDAEVLTDLFVITEDDLEWGISLHPSGEGLFEEFERSLSEDLSESPPGLANQLSDALVTQFELVESAGSEIESGETPESDSETFDRLTIAVNGSAFGPVDRLDHPVASLVAVGYARGLGVPVELSVSEPADERSDFLITCRPERP